CGRRLVGQRRGGRRDTRYRCVATLSGAKTEARSCPGSALAEPVDAQVVAEVGELLEALANPGVERALHRAWRGLAEPETADTAAQRKTLERDATKARERLTRATEMYVDGQLDRDGYDGMVAKARAALEAAEQELARLRKEQPVRALPT